MEYIELRNRLNKPLLIKGLLKSGRNIIIKKGDKAVFHHTEYKGMYQAINIALFSQCYVSWVKGSRRERPYIESELESGDIAIFTYENR